MDNHLSSHWTCSICGKDRPDAAISVQKTDVSVSLKLPEGTVTEHVRFCNDGHTMHPQANGSSLSCADLAPSWRWLKPERYIK